jgi:hypothetical protein
MSPAAAVRAIAVALLVVFAAGWAAVRHFTQKPPPMLVPVGPGGVTPEPTYDIEAGELPVPETLEPDAS